MYIVKKQRHVLLCLYLYDSCQNSQETLARFAVRDTSLWFHHCELLTAAAAAAAVAAAVYRMSGMRQD